MISWMIMQKACHSLILHSPLPQPLNPPRPGGHSVSRYIHIHIKWSSFCKSPSLPSVSVRPFLVWWSLIETNNTHFNGHFELFVLSNDVNYTRNDFAHSDICFVIIFALMGKRRQNHSSCMRITLIAILQQRSYVTRCEYSLWGWSTQSGLAFVCLFLWHVCDSSVS